MKICCSCKLSLSEKVFHSNKTHKDGLSAMCKLCTKNYKVKYYQNKKDYLLKQQKEFYSGPEGRLKYLLNRSRSRAKELNIDHTISVDDLILPEKCPYLGIPLTLNYGNGQLETNASIDRIDNSKGYIPGNVQIISRKANTMKNNASAEELVTFAQNILNITTSL